MKFNRPVLKRASGTIKMVMADMLTREKSDREGWEAVGKALLEARTQFANPLQFGAWIKTEGISEIPGLATSASRSDCIWLAEYPLCAGLVPPDISNPRGVRQAWRKLLAASAKDWAGAGVALETAADHVMKETHAPYDTAIEALHAAASQSLHKPKVSPIGYLPVTKQEATLHKALVKAKKQGVTVEQLLDMAEAVGFAVYALAPTTSTWTPPPEAITTSMRYEHALAVALSEGMLPMDIDAILPVVTYFNAEMAYERARRALELAKDKAFDLEEAKAMVKDVYLGDF
jgi:hypothetical protein